MLTKITPEWAWGRCHAENTLSLNKTKIGIPFPGMEAITHHFVQECTGLIAGTVVENMLYKKFLL